MRILVVDDEEIVRELTVHILERAGYEVVSAPGAREAMAVVEKEQVDLVVSDVAMPGQTGVELLRKLRERRPHLPVVLVTGGSLDPGETAAAPAVDASAIVYKPYTHAELCEAVASALTSS